MPVSHTNRLLHQSVANTDTNEVNMQSPTFSKDKNNAIISQFTPLNKREHIEIAITQAWKIIAPWWPLKNLIATNPLQGFEDRSFEQAISESSQYVNHHALQIQIGKVNTQTIKWCQILFDDGQAVIKMPNKLHGAYNAWRKLILFDEQIHKNNDEVINFIKTLPDRADDTIIACLNRLNIGFADTTRFLTLLLTTLTGWAGYVKYQNQWTQGYIKHTNAVSHDEYLAIRLIITCSLWPDAKDILTQAPTNETKNINTLIKKNEDDYRNKLLSSLQDSYRLQQDNENGIPDAQLVFCIDVRSEPMRRVIEAEGNYETFGFAGFFGIPAIIFDEETKEQYASCPVLISPKHTIVENQPFNNNWVMFTVIKKYKQETKRLYHALKYTFTTPFILAEALGPWCGLTMILRTLFPLTTKNTFAHTGHKHHQQASAKTDITENQYTNQIPFNNQCAYAEGALRTIGLTKNFAALVILCGHGSKTENNAYASALDCGACGGHDGAANAKILAAILNSMDVRQYLKSKDINIPNETHFTAALHNTTTDEIDLLDTTPLADDVVVLKLINDLHQAKLKNNGSRFEKLTGLNSNNASLDIAKRSADWAQTRPEWGLARNAAFIVGPRKLTKNINLDARAFLHSYDWQQDADGGSLTTILTAPMVVAQWINCQYLFSTMDNVAYGSGSKITHNVVGKMGIMQGNASDLMSGLPLQSIMRNDQTPYHQIQRLLTVVHAPKELVSKVIASQDILQKLFGNGWVMLACIDPIDGLTYELQRDLTWLIAGLANK
jgi:uncharacterized protein YbcC (UPF0753/DUF2309 family)